MNTSYIFKLAHKRTKKIIQAGDNYQVTFGAVLKVIYTQVKGYRKLFAKLVAQGYNKSTVEHRIYDKKAGAMGVGGYCLTVNNGQNEVNLTAMLNKKFNTKAFFMSNNGQAKTTAGRLAVVALLSLIK